MLSDMSMHLKLKHTDIEDLFILIYIWVICNLDVNMLGVHEQVDKLKREISSKQPKMTSNVNLEK